MFCFGFLLVLHILIENLPSRDRYDQNHEQFSISGIDLIREESHWVVVLIVTGDCEYYSSSIVLETTTLEQRKWSNYYTNNSTS